MKTIDRSTLSIAPGETATAYVPIPVGCKIQKVDVDPRTAGAFTIVRADFIGPSAMLAETGVRSSALRVVLLNRSSSAQPARLFVDVERDLAIVGRELGGIAENYNRMAHDARARRRAN
jgi:hypothetical protein